MKCIAILSAGSRGDVHPFAALGRAIQDRGLAVRLLTFHPFRKFITELGLEFFPVSDPMDTLKSSADWHRWQSPEIDLPRKLMALRSLIVQSHQPFIRMLDESINGCADCDAIVSSTSGFAGPHIAEKLSLPFCWAFLQPETPTGLFPHYMTPSPRSLGSLVNRATYSAAGWTFQALFGNTVNAWRQKSLGLAPSATGIFGGRNSPPVLYGFSRHVIAKPPDWDERTHITGYWFVGADAEWTPSPEIASFLANGAPPIAVCLDSMKAKADVLDLITSATGQTGQRAVVVTSGQSYSLRKVSDHIFTTSYAPFEWLFPKVAAVVHHGGAGTAASALRAKRPSILVPGFFDQAFWANTMYRLGAAPAPLFGHTLSVRTLTSGIEAVIGRPGYRQRAAILGERIAEEDGAGSAADLILRYFS